VLCFLFLFLRSKVDEDSDEEYGEYGDEYYDDEVEPYDDGTAALSSALANEEEHEGKGSNL
jgi:hypothetical protein